MERQTHKLSKLKKKEAMGVLGQNQSPRMNTKREAIPSLKATLGEI